MKNLLIVTVLLSAVTTTAQSRKGTIAYTETINLQIELEGEAAAFAAMIPKEQKSNKVLYYTTEATLYKNAEEDEPRKTAANTNGMRVMISTSNSDDRTYIKLNEKKKIQKKEFMGRTFLITGDLEKQNWKMTGKQKEILGYPCQQAVRYTDEDTFTVWFTPAIAVPAGPSELGMLPGMILEAQINKQVNIIATEVNEEQLDENVMKEPRDGKKVSADKFAAIVKEKTKEMQEQFGGRGGNIIRMEIRE